MQPDKEQIERFLKRECSPEEAQLIWKYFKAFPQQLDEYLSEDEWLNFNDVKKLKPEVSQRILAGIESNVPDEKSPVKLWRYVSVAASILIISAVSLLLWVNNESPVHQSASLKTSPVIQQPQFCTISNYTGINKTVTLEDGSVVTLYSKTELNYQKPFSRTKRDLYLKGKALFKVAKDKARPFTVYASGLGTTALGTVFKITAYPNSNKVKVRLLEGKVVVRPSKELVAKGVRAAYLIPGHELLLDKLTMQAVVQDMSKRQPQETKQAVQHPPSDVLEFKDEPLADIFRRLEKEYQRSINVESETVGKIYFTGRFNKRQDSIEDILNIISTLNSLQFTEENNVFTIKDK